MESGSNRTRNVLVGVVLVIVFLLIIIFFIRRGQTSNEVPIFSPYPSTTSNYSQELQNNFGITLPSSAVKADLKDVTGGNQMGIATSDKENGQNVYTILANLQDPQSGYFYEAWILRGKPGDSNYDLVSLGRLNLAKGGYLVNYSTSKDLSDHKNIWVTLENVLDNTPHQHILEGSF